MGNPRVERLIQRALSEVFLYDMRDELAPLMVSVTRVSVTPRLERADVYVSAALVEDAPKLEALLNSHRKRLRLLLGQRIRNKVRHIPELRFILDDSVLFQERIDELIGKKPPVPDVADDQDDGDEENDQA